MPFCAGKADAWKSWMPMSDPLFYFLMAVVAFLYGSVGHGGGSGYLALMALWDFSHLTMKPTALTLNLVVAGLAFFLYFRRGYFMPRLFYALAAGSIPMAFAGGMLHPDAFWYKKLLAVFLFLAVLKLSGAFNRLPASAPHRPAWYQAVALGAVIGLVSGFIGIGGGVLLTPVILLLRWGNIREAAAVTALFIWVNSAAALAGLWLGQVAFPPHLPLLVALAALGGWLGSYWGSAILNEWRLQRVLAVVLLLAGFKLLLT